MTYYIFKLNTTGSSVLIYSCLVLVLWEVIIIPYYSFDWFKRMYFGGVV